MRVITGSLRSRVLVAPRGMGTRPTSDRLRETLFNVLGQRIAGARFADLYAGSGAVGIEALSRGASDCLFVEQAPPALAALRRNLENLGLSSAAHIEARPVLRALQATRQSPAFDLIFLDPPYEAEAEYSSTLQLLGSPGRTFLAKDAIVIAEHARRKPLPAGFGQLQRNRLLEQGDAALSFYRLQPSSDAPDN